MILRTVFSRVFPSQARIHVAPSPLLCMRSRYSCSFQQLSPKQKETIIRSYLSSEYQQKLYSLKPQQFYKDLSKSYRTELIKHIRSLKFSHKRENSTFEKEIVDSFLQAYEFGKGYQFDKSELSDARNKDFADEQKRVVFNPTSLSHQILDLSYWAPNIIIGNFGIGKSFALRNFQYLSFYRFKLLNDSLVKKNDSLVQKAKADYKMWLQVNNPGLLRNENSQKQREKKLNWAAQQLMLVPLVVYLELKQKASWKALYQELQQQFPYISIPFSPQPNTQNLSDEQIELKRQLMYKTKSEHLCFELRKHFEQLQKNFKINIRLVIDQTNCYFRSVKILQKEQKQYRKNKKPWNFKESQHYPQAKKISEQISTLHSMNLRHKIYYFSEMAQTELLENQDIFQKYRFARIYLKIYGGEDQNIQQILGICLIQKQGQAQMFLIIGQLLQQALVIKLAPFKKMNEQKLQESIRGIIRQKYKQTRLNINTTYYIAAKIMEQFKQRIPQLAEQLSSKGINEQISAFLDEYLKDLEEKGTAIYFQRLQKKVDSVLQLQQKENMVRFHRTLLQVQQIKRLKYRKQSLQYLQPKDEKVHSSDLLQEEATDLYKGEFNGTLKGCMYGKEFKGKFEGIVYSGKIIKKDQKGKFFKDEIHQSQLKPDQQMTLQDAVFQGTFVGSASKGRLMGSMKGTVYGYRLPASGKIYKNYNISETEIGPFVNQFYDSYKLRDLKSIQQLSPQMQSFFQSLTPRGLCEVNQLSLFQRLSQSNDEQEDIYGKDGKNLYLMTIFQSKKCLIQVLRLVFGKYINKKVISLLRTFVFHQLTFYSQYDKFVTFGLSELDLTLQIAGKKIKLVNGNQENTFIQFNAQDMSFGQRFGQLIERVQKLPQGQGLGVRPVSKILSYPKTSKPIECVLIYKKANQQTCFITLGYLLGKQWDDVSWSEVSEKISDHRKFYQERLQKDFQKSEQKFNFKDRYMHYIVLTDQAYRRYYNQLEELYYIKVIKLSQLRFEFEHQPFSDTPETRPEAVQKMIAASIYASWLS